MTKEITYLQRHLKSHHENYNSLKNEDIYKAYKKHNIKLSTDQLDYLMCQALCSMPIYLPHIKSDSEWDLLTILNQIFDTRNNIEPQLDMIYLVTHNRDLLDIYNDWQKSVITLFELIISKNLLCVHEDLKRLKELKQREQNKNTVLFSNQLALSDDQDSDEECCNWVTRSFTAMFF